LKPWWWKKVNSGK